MAVNKKQFSQCVDTNLKANKTYDIFYVNFVKEGRRVNRVFNYSDKNWDKKTRINKAKLDLLNLRNNVNNSGTSLNDNSTLDQIAEIYFINRQLSNWTKELRDVYETHIVNILGKRKIKSIKKVDIDSLITSLRKKGKSKQTRDGCSSRTIKKVIIECLYPIFKYALENLVIEKLPVFPTIKLNRKKKIVSNAKQKLIVLFRVINNEYKDNPFYRALFLFALYGRRWNEIRTLEWSDIDFKKNTYTIRAENNKIKENQTYDLAPIMKSALNEIVDDHFGLVFKSPVTGKKLYSPRTQLSRIKKASNINELKMHYFRHILVSAMGEMGIATTVLSASLGHTNLNTVNDFYLSANHTKGSKITNDTIKQITQKSE